MYMYTHLSCCYSLVNSGKDQAKIIRVLGYLGGHSILHFNSSFLNFLMPLIPLWSYGGNVRTFLTAITWTKKRRKNVQSLLTWEGWAREMDERLMLYGRTRVAYVVGHWAGQIFTWVRRRRRRPGDDPRLGCRGAKAPLSSSQSRWTDLSQLWIGW